MVEKDCGCKLKDGAACNVKKPDKWENKIVSRETLEEWKKQVADDYKFWGPEQSRYYLNRALHIIGRLLDHLDADGVEVK